MPRDKTDTHNKLLPCIKQEFLEHGYEKASMQISQDEQELLLRGYIAIFQAKRLCLLQW